VNSVVVRISCDFQWKDLILDLFCVPIYLLVPVLDLSVFNIRSGVLFVFCAQLCCVFSVWLFSSVLVSKDLGTGLPS
jgi:hypothetical protein